LGVSRPLRHLWLRAQTPPPGGVGRRFQVTAPPWIGLTPKERLMLPMLASVPPGALLVGTWLITIVILAVGAMLERNGCDSRLREMGPKIGDGRWPATEPDRSSRPVDVQGHAGRL